MMWPTILNTAWRVLARVPAWLWGVLLVALLLGGVRWYGEAQRERGRQDMVLDGLRYDRDVLRIQREFYRRQLDSLRHRLDAHTGTVAGTVRDAQRVASRIPPAVRRVPQVDTLVQLVDALAPQVAELTATIASERAAASALVASYEQSLQHVTATAQQQAARIVELERRPTRRAAAVRVVLGVAVGVVVGFVL